jgi:allantoate deiminase
MNDAPLFDWLETAARFSLPGPGVSRFFLTKEHHQLIGYLQSLMVECGLRTHLDDAGNLVGRKISNVSDNVLYIGSHQDTVPNGGRFDGMLGILLALSAVYELRDINHPFNLEVVAFGDEEGTRFNSTLLGSKALSGTFDESALSARDDQGMSIAEALHDFGLNPKKIPSIARDQKNALGYIEAHIEQGPVLESQNLPVGVVSSITGIERHAVSIKGQAGHAGTVPMRLRKDALVAASLYVQWVDTYCKETEDMVGVVGKIEIGPNSVNVIPESAKLTIELRSPYKDVRVRARKALSMLTSRLVDSGFAVNSELLYSQEGLICDQVLVRKLETAIQKENIPPVKLYSGAGHDALAMAALCPVAMLFVRCKDGLSHHHEESVDINDAIAAKRVLKRFIRDFI